MMLSGMARGASGNRSVQSWQLVLADLALILFLVMLAVLAATQKEPQKWGKQARSNAPELIDLAPSQALFRPSRNGPGIRQWLSDQPLDRRATLTVIAHYRAADRAEIWKKAEVLAQDAAAVHQNVRVVISSGEENDLYASLAYDALRPESQSASTLFRPDSLAR